MCGIAGFVQRQRDDATLERMLGGIARRGPDGQGTWNHESQGWWVQLGHRRLSIIDLEGGAQPLGNEDASVQISFNGEIFNFQELRAECERAGHRFHTRSDTETIVHHYETHGAQGFAGLNGMFAFALWDGSKRELLLARDPAGIKPLYYWSAPDGGLAFASELASLLAHPKLPRKLSGEGLTSYLFIDYAHAPSSLIAGVRKLEPGHYVSWRDGKLSEPRRFASLTESVERSGAAGDVSEAKLAEELRERLRLAVRRQLIADVPVGVFLSGGIDSSTVAALAAGEARDKLQTFSIAFTEKTFDESEHARAVARHLGTRHHEQVVTEQDLIARVGEVFDRLDEPMADPSLIPTYLLSELASRHVKVTLGGDAGDELWAGYPTYLAHRFGGFLSLVPRPLLDGVVAPAVRSLPVSDQYQALEWKLKRLVLRWHRDPAFRHLRWMSNTDPTELPALFPAATDPAALFAPALAAASRVLERDRVNAMLRLDFESYMPGSVLAKVDRASMAHGLEVRPPFLDHELARWAFSLPSSVKLKGRSRKHLLKLAAAPLLPPEIVGRRKKGFAIPLNTWLRGPLQKRVEAMLAESPLWERGGLSRDTARAWNAEHLERRVDRSKTLWALIILDHWMKREGVRC